MPFSILHMRLVRFLRLKPSSHPHISHHLPIYQQPTPRDQPINWDYITAGNTGPNGADTSWCRGFFGKTGWFFVKGVVDSSNL